MLKINNRRNNGRAILMDINNEALHLCKLICDMKAHHEKRVIEIAKTRETYIYAICIQIFKLRHSIAACRNKKINAYAFLHKHN